MNLEEVQDILLGMTSTSINIDKALECIEDEIEEITIIVEEERERESLAIDVEEFNKLNPDIPGLVDIRS